MSSHIVNLKQKAIFYYKFDITHFHFSLFARLTKTTALGSQSINSKGTIIFVVHIICIVQSVSLYTNVLELLLH